MEHEELKKRIKKMSLPQIAHMSYNNFAILTDNFCEELFMELITKVDSNELQRRMYDIIKEKYDDWQYSRGIGRPFISYPEHFKKTDFRLECGDTIEKEYPQMIGGWDDIDNRQFIGHLDDINDEGEDLVVLYEDCAAENEQLKKENTQLKEENKQLKLQPNTTESKSRIKELETKLEQATAENEKLKEQLAKGTASPQKGEYDRLKERYEETIAELLAPAFYNDAAEAKRFLRKIEGLDNVGVADVAVQFLKDRKIMPSKSKMDIWKYIHAAKLYDGTEQNWSAAIRKFL